MKIREIQAKSILQKSGIPGADWVINPYTGCSHNCVYCYAAFMKRWTGHLSDNWGEFVDVKINSPELLKKQVKKIKKGDSVFIASVCDAYQKAEKKYQLMGKILAILAKQAREVDFGVSILTKSDLVTRDIDILKKFKDAEVGFSLGIPDRKYQKILEPGAPEPEKRTAALKKLHRAGIKIYLFISPIIPKVSDPQKSFELCRNNFDYFMAEAINTRSINYKRLLNKIKQYFPDKFENLDEMARDEGFWRVTEEELEELGRKNKIEFKGLFRHGV
jgi:DNA repair photolyase